jgi:ankyrin repeat protein
MISPPVRQATHPHPVVWIADWRGVLRLVAEFSDHTEIAQLSRTRLDTLAPGATVATGPLSPAVQRQKDLLAQELALVEQQIAERRNQISVGRASPIDLVPLQREALSLQRQMAALDATRVDLLSEVLLPSAAPTDSSLPIDSMSEEEQRELDRLMELVRNSPDLINSSTRSGPPLHSAAQKGQLAVARFLIENGADLELPDNVTMTPLHRAVEGGHKAMTEMFLAAGAEANAAGFSALHLAARSGFTEIAKVLLAAGADVNAVAHGGTPLHEAIPRNRMPMIDLLLNSGADLEATTPVHYEPAPGYTPLMLAVGYNFPSIAEHLLIRGANVNATNAAGETVLQLAARLETPAQTLRSILERKPDLEARNPRNLTPLQVACLNLNHGTVRILLEAGANPERLLEAGADPNAATTSGATPMHAAALWPPPAVMQKLLDHGGKVDPQDELGNTPLHVAARANYREMVRFLLARGAAVNARNQRGETPLDIATGRTPYQVWPGRGLIEAIDQRTFAAPPSDAIADLLRKHGAKHGS